MSKNIYGLTNLTNEAVVEVIRRKFLLEANTNPVLYHPIDMERCRTEDWQIERFFLEKGTPDDALEALIKAMRWKKSFGVHDRSHTHFPREFLPILGHQKSSRDREGRLCIWGVARNYVKIAEFSKLFKQYSAFQFENRDREAGNKGFVSIVDTQGISWSNVDMSMAKFGSELMEYYPGAFKIGCNLDVHWLMNSVFKLVLSVIPKSTKDKIMIIKRQEICDYIDIDVNEVPVSVGGNREVVYDLMDDMLPLRQCKHLDFTDKQIDYFYKVYNFDKI